MRTAPALAVGTALLALVACTPQPGTAQPSRPVPPTPPPASTAPPSVAPGPPYQPEAVLAALATTVRSRGTVPPPSLLAEDELASVQITPCRLFTAEARPGESFTPPLPIFAGLVEVNPIASFTSVERATTIMEVTVTGFASAAAAERVADRARSARCTPGFTLSYTTTDARRATDVIRIGASRARLTTGTALGPHPEQGFGFVPGEARLLLAHGPLLLTVGVLRLWQGSTGPEVTAMARRTAIEVATAALRALPLTGTPTTPAATPS
ncbi:hypothetical protein [Plantactinospora sp. BC1]|uniref:hypothetical protein n=1 Tax=Plantactinospora sp. BC1 TaxID=2108470 RepID=UPI00131F3DFD|nr:hypothetical protein [Plantactinospora sp. BC1]